jgi:predicted lipoprotein with Yx(FWY)xxD motif
MSVGRLNLVRLFAGIALLSLVAACTAAGTGPTSAPPLGSEAPLVASEAPTASALAVVSPAAATNPAATPSAQGGGGGRYGTGATPTPKATAKPTSKPAPSITIKSGSTSLGTVLVGSDGLTLYTHAGDSSSHSSCTGSCASAWPPLLVKAGTKVKDGSGVHGQFATFKRADGTTQVTYNGKPLYAWTGDYYAGDTTGQGINGFTIAKV